MTKDSEFTITFEVIPKTLFVYSQTQLSNILKNANHVHLFCSGNPFHNVWCWKKGIVKEEDSKCDLSCELFHTYTVESLIVKDHSC